MGPLRTPPAINSTIKALLEGARDSESPLGIEEVSNYSFVTFYFRRSEFSILIINYYLNLFRIV